MLKFFAEKMWEATHIFSAKNIRILYIESAKTVNKMTLNELVKLTTLWFVKIYIEWYANMLKLFAEKMWVASAVQKLLTFFSAKNIRILYIESAKTVNKMTLNELVKLTTLWTTGPRFIWLRQTRSWLYIWQHSVSWPKGDNPFLYE